MPDPLSAHINAPELFAQLRKPICSHQNLRPAATEPDLAAIPEWCWLFFFLRKLELEICVTQPSTESRQHSWYGANNRTMSRLGLRQKSWFRRKTVTHGTGLCHRLVTLWIICLTAVMSFPVPLSEIFKSELLSFTWLSVSEWGSQGAECLATEQTHSTDTEAYRPLSCSVVEPFLHVMELSESASLYYKG